jgi:hypothetical protein
VKKGTVIGDEISKTFHYQRIYKNVRNGLGSFSIDIYAYDGDGQIDWGRDEAGMFLILVGLNLG